MFENIISGLQRFYICPDVPVDIIRVFFDFRFSSRKSQSQQKLTKKITHFIIQFFTHKTSLVFRASTHLTLKIISTCNTAKKLSDFIHFSACFCLLSEKTFALHHFLTPRAAFLKHFESKCLNILIYLIKKIFVSET